MGVRKKLLKILSFSSVKKAAFLFLFFLAAFSSFLEVLPAEIIGRFSNSLAEANSNGALWWCLLYFAVAAFGAAVRNFFCYSTSKLANTLIRDLRTASYAKLLSVDFSKLTEPDSGYFVNMINGNCSRLENVFSVALFTMVSDIFDLFWISVFICAIDWKLLGIMLGFVPVLYLLGRLSSKMQRKLAVQRIDMESAMIGKIHETYANRTAIRIFAGCQRETAEFGRQSDAYSDKSNQADAALSLFYILEKSIRCIAITLVIFITAREITAGRYALGALLSIVLYSQKFYAPITNIIRYIQMIQKGMASVDALQKFLDSDDLYPGENLTFSDHCEFASVRQAQVRAGEMRILSPVSFDIGRKSMNLLTGPSGCGKTTLLKAMLGDMKLSGGQITVRADADRAALFSYASQDTEVFSGTVLENVLYPRNVNEVPADMVQKAESLLFKLGFARDRLNRSVGEAGADLSGGEKKRIAFARAVLRPSEFLILDEITSNLDADNENVMASMIVEESRKRCVILVTHKEHPAFASANIQRIQIAPD